MALSGTELEQVLAEARSGNSPALGQLLDQYRAYLSLLARLHVSKPLAAHVDASDVVQEAFLRAGRAFPQFRGNTERELLAWLRRILARSIADQARQHEASRAANLQRLFGSLECSSQALDAGLLRHASTPSERSAHREQAVLLADALARLPEHYREVLVLRHMEELSFPEISEQMGRSLDGVKHLWIRAVAALHSAYGDQS